MFRLLLVGALLVVAGPAQAADAPEWPKNEMKQLFAQAQASTQAPSVEVKDNALLMMAAQAYRVPRVGTESSERYAERVLKKRVPDHPMVKGGQWLTALLRQFYADAADRSAALARFELDRGDRRFFEQMAEQSKVVADALAERVEVVVEGLDSAIEPLPQIGGAEPTKIGAMVIVKGSAIEIEKLKRATFVNHLPKDDAPRTAKGELKELYSALKQYNIQSKMFGQYDPAWRHNGGHVRAVIPASRPSIYLNEIARAAIPAGMHTLHLMTLSKAGELKEIVLTIGTPKKTKKKRRRRKKKQKTEKLVEVTCADNMPMATCGLRILHAQTQGRPHYRP